MTTRTLQADTVAEAYLELLRDRGKRRDLARRPKKYYVADQGLRPGGEAALPAVRRRRRSA